MRGWFQHERRPHMYGTICEEVEQDSSAARLTIIPTSLLTGYLELETISPEKLSMITWVKTKTKPRADIERLIEKRQKVIVWTM